MNPYPQHPGFGLRVAYAVKAIKRYATDPLYYPFTRAFDNCFEMYDGDAVVWTLMEKASTDEVLSAGINKMFAGSPTQWAAIHALTRVKDASNQQLALILA